MAFIYTELTFSVIPIETLTVSFDTVVSVAQDKQEKRLPKRVEPRFSFSFDVLTLKKSEVLDLERFFESVDGNVNSFRYRSYIDNSCTYIGEFYEQENASIRASSYGKFFSVGKGKWQGVKVWQLNNQNASKIAIAYQTLRLLDEANFRVFVNDVEQLEAVYKIGLNSLADVIKL